MIETMLDADFSGSSKDWAASLVTEIQVRNPSRLYRWHSYYVEMQTGDFKSLAAGWISCSSITEPLSQRRSLKDEIMETIAARATSKPITPLACPLVWAQESNAFDCVRIQPPFLCKH